MKAVKFAAITLCLTAAPAMADMDAEAGKRVYDMHCLSCHQADGGGVPMMQPELWASDRANGPAEDLIRFVLGGSQSLPAEERQYDNEMPAFTFLSDKDLVAVINYVRTHFENNAKKITPDDVARVRDRLP